MRNGIALQKTPVRWLAVLCLWAKVAVSCLAAGHERPNIVVILADDMGWSDLGCYGSEIRTPALDKLSQEGVLATRFYTVPRCSPSRACLMTGLYPQSVGVGHLDKDLHKPGYRGFIGHEVPILPELLKKAGYRTYMAGKWHVGSGEGCRPNDRGFDRYRGLLSGACDYFTLDPGRMMAEDGKLLQASDLPKDFYMTEDITTTAITYLDDAAKMGSSDKKPFFLYVAYTAPHTPLEAKASTIESYRATYRKGARSIQADRLKKQKKLGIIPKETQIPADRQLPGKCSDEEALRMAVYAAQVTDMDEGIGRILKRLDELKLSRNTLVIFLSDNGATKEVPKKKYEPVSGVQWNTSGYGQTWATVSNTPYKGYKIGTHEGGVSVPCLMRLPTAWKAGQLYHRPMHMMDVAPLLLRAAGHPELSGRMDGRIPALKQTGGNTGPWKTVAHVDRLIFCEHEKNVLVLSSEYKAVKMHGEPKWQLYALSDRLEIRDLADKVPNELNRLKEAYKTWADTHQVDSTISNYYPKEGH